MQQPAWWHGAAIYQIYPRSFLDTNGDGVGDLPGIIERLDYVASLGVEAIWISPFFKSPMADFGYDIADYRAVDPLFGSLGDFDRLLGKAHRFWLDRGVDGMRLDAINFCFHDRQLRDNPPKPLEQRTGRGFPADNPYAYQYHVYNNTRPENVPFIEELRRLTDRYSGAVTLGEISAEDSNATIAEYTRPGRLHMGYSFELLSSEHSPAHIRATVEGALAASAEAWPCWSISNHDVQRVVSRWGRPDSPPHLATLFTALVCSLRGAVCIYQGEELGLREADVPFEALRDPYGIAFWPKFKGRDGCRTPMPWRRQPNCRACSQARR